MTGGVDAGSDLLLGLLALRREEIDRDQLIAALDRWMATGNKALGEFLVEQGALTRAARSRLARLATESFKGRQEAPDSSQTQAYDGTGSNASRPDGKSDLAAGQPVEQASQPRFHILRSHARGGLGEVFLALDAELKRQVALKALQAYHAHDPISQARFLLEAEITGRLEHPGIVPIYGLGRSPDGRPYYVMRFIEGETLKAAITRFHGPDSERQGEREREVAFRRLLQSLIASANAIAYAHLRGVVHRDVKPENIMLGPFGETLVVDWGMAKTLDDLQQPSGAPDRSSSSPDGSLTRTGAAVGTPRYMSPEQAAGNLKLVGPATDIYGLGATLYCLLLGHAPFTDGDLADVLDRVQRGIFPSPRSLRRSIDQALEAICLKAMALDPQERHASALEFGGEIEAWLADVRYRGEQVRALNQVRGSFTRLCIERAENLFGREKHNEGMLWLARALENVPADSPGLERVVRASLGSWHARARLIERSLRHGGEVWALAFSPDGHRLVTASQDRTARLWDVATGHPLAGAMSHDGPVLAVGFCPDGKSLATAGLDGKLRRWNALTSSPLGEPMALGVPISSLAFSPDGSLVATGSRLLVPFLWKTVKGKPVHRLTGADAAVLSVAFDPQGALLAIACDDGRVLCVQTSTGKPRGEPLAHPAAVASLAFDCDGQTLLTGCNDGKARLWDVENIVVAREFALAGPVCLVALGPSGAIVTACADGTARLWDPERGHPIGEPLVHGARIECLAFSPDGSILATGSRDRTARLWDTATGLSIGPPLEHRGTVSALAFSPDGRRLATACADGHARFWRVAPQIPGDLERIASWVRVTTELDFDSGDAIRKLDPLVGWELRRRLTELGGPPPRKIEKW
jgi:WD40 repeat protein/serine/threonine protein kinase